MHTLSHPTRVGGQAWRLACVLSALGVPVLSAGDFDVRAFGARADFQTNDGTAIQAAIDACHKAGGGTVVVPAGRYLTSGLQLKSHVTLRLDNGATLYASQKKEDYPRGEGGGPGRGILLTANDAEDIAVLGQGILHGQATDDFGKRWGATEQDRFRTGIILFTNCRRVVLRDFKILYSDWWTVHLRRCDGVVIDGLTIFNNVKHLNSDGIDPNSCTNVHISNTRVTAGDDAIDLKSYGGYPTENVVVSNCTLETTTTGLKIGTATDGDFRNVHFSNITIKAPSGIGIYLKDGGTLEHMTFSNITIENPPATYRVATPVFVDIEKRHATSRLSHARDISFRDLFIRGGSGILIQGMPESRIENLSIDNLNFRVTAPDSFEKRVKPVGGTRTTQDERDTKYARLPSYMALAYIDGLHLNGIRIVQDEKARAQYERSAVVIHEAKDVMVHGLESTPPRGKLGLPVINLYHVDGALLSDGVALPGTGTFVEVSGASRDVVVTGGRLSGAATVKRETR